MCTCEHIEVICQVTCVLKYRKVPELELIPPQLDGQQLGRSWMWERAWCSPVHQNQIDQLSYRVKAGTGAGTSSVSKLVLFPEMKFVVWMRKRAEILNFPELVAKFIHI